MGDATCSLGADALKAGWACERRFFLRLRKTFVAACRTGGFEGPGGLRSVGDWGDERGRIMVETVVTFHPPEQQQWEQIFRRSIHSGVQPSYCCLSDCEPFSICRRLRSALVTWFNSWNPLYA